MVGERFFYGETMDYTKKKPMHKIQKTMIPPSQMRKSAVKKPLSPDISKRRMALGKTLMGKG